ncbi:52 kDa repressor of the inhibitor of the protein kinase-like [Macrosteles quadrilineatus]|uniref:52 kDa repressor of the inhibitor of the protein kinase-like n=1 Tax=Macrosteles quadrilineatus TaxID=74068 RepID=UPI0023E0FC0A|nr:52 kDa repressor of the inhibitor of the protein kinase-like [Macrosteles quadrilineatus]
MKRQVAIDSFFVKKTKTVNKDADEESPSPSQKEPPRPLTSSITLEEESVKSLSEPQSGQNELRIPVRDFGLLLEKKNAVTDYERYDWFHNHWTPPPAFKFPVKREGNKNRSFQTSWLNQYSWLVYSEELGGGLCKACVLFGRGEGGKSDGKLGNLVIEPLTTFKKATEIFKKHDRAQYHINNMKAATHLSNILSGKDDDVVTQLNTAQKALVEENKRKLIPIIKTIMFCGIQNIPLRGHRDDGELLNVSTETEQDRRNDGNFRALLRFRIDAGDKDLESHIQSCGKNSSYISKTIQNDLIQCCGEVITNKIVSKVKSSKYFTIMADETTDMSTKEQLSICIRYLDKVKFEIKEDFLMFLNVVDLTGEGISKKILETLCSLGIDINDCRGQAYDGCSNMSGRFSGVQARIKTIQPLAVYCHCASHKLNLVISKACSIPQIRNAVGVVSSVSNYFRDSAKRLHSLEAEMGEDFKKGKNAVKKMCETRWIERHDAVLTFLSSLPTLHIVLETMAHSNDEGGNKAFSLLHAIVSSEFIIGLVVLEHFMNLTLPLAKQLQAEYMDVLSALALVDATLKSLNEQRTDCIKNFKILYEKAQQLATKMGSDIKKPRIIGSQRHRSNIDCGTPEEYFRTSIYVPFLDFLISELNSRFPKTELSQIGKLQMLLPAEGRFQEGFQDLVLEGARLYANDLPCYDALKGELSIWKHMWASRSQDFPKCPAHAMRYTTSLPNISVLIQIICTIPVTTSTAERSFSALRRLKTYLRTTITEERLNGLANLHINQSVSSKISADEVLTLFAKKHKRKLSFALN